MSDPITIGAGVGAGISMLRGGNPLKGAAVGGLGGAGYGALTGSGWAGNLLSQGGLLNTASSGTFPTILKGTGSVSPNLFDKIGGLATSAGNWMKENPTATMGGMVAAQNLMQPQPTYQIDTSAQGPNIIPSQESVGNYLPRHLISQVQKPRIDVTAPAMGATTPYRTFGFGGQNMFRDPREEYLNYPQY